MLHPIVALPLIRLIKLIINGIEKLLGLCKIDARGKLKFTLTMYIAIIITFQVFLTQSWASISQNVKAKHGKDR
jgi:hypothetical protein